MLILAARLPKPRQFMHEQINGWIAENETDLRRLKKGA